MQHLTRCQLFRLFCMLLIINALTGCATYWVDRKNDLLDIPVVAASVGAGASVNVGPFHSGLTWTGGDAGLHGGTLTTNNAGHAWATQLELLYAGCEHFGGRKIFDCIGDETRTNLKWYWTREDSFKDTWTPFITTNLHTCSMERLGNAGPPPSIHPYWFRVEAQGSCIIGARCGINVGELADFILGWSTIDIFADDVESKRANAIKIKIERLPPSGDNALVVLSRAKLGESILLPKSNYVHAKDVTLVGCNGELNAWAQVSKRDDALLPTTQDKRPFLEFRALVQNKSQKNVNVSSAETVVKTAENKFIYAFEGEWWDDSLWLGPSVIEKDGEDMSMEHLQQIELAPGQYAVFEVSFPMSGITKEADAVNIADVLFIK